jgi:DNA invertase Pin-like site-specific DNA recombinase
MGLIERRHLRERNLIVERVRAGMRRARLEGRHIGRQPLMLDEPAILRERNHGQSLRQIAKTHRISTATVRRVLHTNTSQQTTGELVMTMTGKPV